MTEVTTAPAPDDEPTPEEFAAASHIRPLEDLPSNWTVKGNPTILAPTLAALSPDQQAVVLERAGSADPKALDDALRTFLREKSAEARLLTGAGEGATEAERTALDQVSTLRTLSNDAARLEAELADVVEHRTEYQEGKPVAVPVYRHNGDGRTAREASLREVQYRMTLVAGVEGDKELQEAVRRDALRTREINRQLEERAAMKALGEQTLRDERIRAGAENYAQHRRQTLG